MSEIVNRVAQSTLLTLNLEDYAPSQEIVIYDLKDNLVEAFFLKEKVFRAFVKEHDWSQYANKVVALFCSIDVIIPVWAYMLVTSELEKHADRVLFGSKLEVVNALWRASLEGIDLKKFQDRKVIIKGCGQIPVPASAYTEITRLLLPVVHSLMYGEACSSVPVYKKAKLKERG